jgi:hypothetical protein
MEKMCGKKEVEKFALNNLAISKGYVNEIWLTSYGSKILQCCQHVVR